MPRPARVVLLLLSAFAYIANADEQFALGGVAAEVECNTCVECQPITTVATGTTVIRETVTTKEPFTAPPAFPGATIQTTIIPTVTEPGKPPATTVIWATSSPTTFPIPRAPEPTPGEDPKPSGTWTVISSTLSHSDITLVIPILTSIPPGLLNTKILTVTSVRTVQVTVPATTVTETIAKATATTTITRPPLPAVTVAKSTKTTTITAPATTITSISVSVSTVPASSCPPVASASNCPPPPPPPPQATVTATVGVSPDPDVFCAPYRSAPGTGSSSGASSPPPPPPAAVPQQAPSWSLFGFF